MNETRFGASPDFSLTFGERVRESIRRRLTLSGAREAWWEKHQDKVEQFKKIEANLSPSQRERVMGRLEKQASKGAFGEVSLNYVALASLIGTLYVGGKILYDALIGMRIRPKIEQAKYSMRHPVESLKNTLDRAQSIRSGTTIKRQPQHV